MVISSIDKPADGRKRNRPSRTKSGDNIPEEMDGRRKIMGVVQRRMQERALNYQTVLASNVRTLRTSRGWSQQYLADQVGWYRTTVIRLETGERCPSYSDVCILADVLGVTVDVMSKDLSWLYSVHNAGTLPEALRSTRLAENLSQENVAEACGISRTQYVNIETGKVKPDAALMAKLTKVFSRPIKFVEAVSPSTN